MEQDILHVLGTDGPLHITEIATRIDGHPITVDQACERLHNDGYISPIGGGRYHLTDDGHKYISDDCATKRR